MESLEMCVVHLHQLYAAALLKCSLTDLTDDPTPCLCLCQNRAWWPSAQPSIQTPAAHVGNPNAVPGS